MSSSFDLLRYGLSVAVVAITAWETAKSLRSGTARPLLELFHFQQFGRSENGPFFWGVIVFNIGLAVLMLLLLLVVMR